MNVTYSERKNGDLFLSLVVPVYNEEETLWHVYERMTKLFRSPDWDCFSKIELIFVDDGSTDCTPELLSKITRADWEPRVDAKSLHFSRNFGHSAAVVAGLDASRGDMVALLDADLQDPPDLIPAMCQHILEGWDVVYGQRLMRQGETWHKRLAAWIFYRVLCILSGFSFPKDTGDFRVMTREVCDAVKSCNETDPFLRGLISWLGFRQMPFPYVREARLHGVTKYPFRKMLRFASMALVGFSSLPLRIALYLGIFGLFLFASLSVWAVLMNFRGIAVPGWTSLLIGVTWGQSILLVMIGILGVYVGRVHTEVQGRPRYVMRHRRVIESD